MSGNEPKSQDGRKRRQKRTGRMATATVQAKELVIKAPYRKGQKLANVKMNAVFVMEIILLVLAVMVYQILVSLMIIV